MTCKQRAVPFVSIWNLRASNSGVSTYNPSRKYFCRDNVAGNAVSKGPSKSVDVDPDDSDDATRWSAGDGLGIGASKSQI